MKPTDPMKAFNEGLEKSLDRLVVNITPDEDGGSQYEDAEQQIQVEEEQQAEAMAAISRAAARLVVDEMTKLKGLRRRNDACVNLEHVDAALAPYRALLDGEVGK